MKITYKRLEYYSGAQQAYSIHRDGELVGHIFNPRYSGSYYNWRFKFTRDIDSTRKEYGTFALLRDAKTEVSKLLESM